MPRKRKKPGALPVIDPLKERLKRDKKRRESGYTSMGVRFSRSEWELLHKAANLYGLTRTAFIKRAILLVIQSHNKRVRERRAQHGPSHKASAPQREKEET